MKLEGQIQKMEVAYDSPVRYGLIVGQETVPLNPLLGKKLSLTFQGVINCIHCNRSTSKSFNQGYCYPCFTRLARCDICIVKPERCHFIQGTCREPEWGRRNCLIPHSVYLANSSGLKVGISRGTEPYTRWIDQGASQGLVIHSVDTRYESGLVEVAYKQYVSDRTDWRKMLRGEPSPLDLDREREDLLNRYQQDHRQEKLPGIPVRDGVPLNITYPVLAYPDKVKSHNLDKSKLLQGTLLGIKGQYLMLDTAVINVRKHAGYVLMVEL